MEQNENIKQQQQEQIQQKNTKSYKINKIVQTNAQYISIYRYNSLKAMEREREREREL